MDDFDRTVSLARLRPALYAHGCRVELPGLDRRRAGRAVFNAHYRNAELDVNLRTAKIGCPGV
jgi:hypothetical protein